ncbi:transcriptional regulator [archaeon]|nr:transcriptional regulator [archaeon]
MSSVALMWRLNESRYNMIGTKCTTCNGLYFPPKALCPECRRKGAITPHKFSGIGEIESFTIIHNAPQGFEEQVPYIVAIIKTDGNVRISGQIIDIDVNEIEKNNIDLIGKKVSHIFRRLFQDNSSGLIHYGLKWQIKE